MYDGWCDGVGLLGRVWLAEIGLTVPPLNDKHAIVIPTIEMVRVMVTIRGDLVDLLRGASGRGYLRRKWLMKRLWLRIQRAATGQRRH